MATRQEQFKQKRKHWQEHLSAWQDSGKTQTDYCREQSLNIKTFMYWRRKLARSTEGIRLVQVPSMPASTSAMRLIIDERYAIEVSEGFSPGTLKQLVHAVQGL